MSPDLIEGKIAKIISNFTVIINKGSSDGVKDGFRFLIYSDGDRIDDPDTGRSLGNLEIVKGKVKVTNTQEKFSTAESDEFETYFMSGLGVPNIGGLGGRETTRKKSLNIGVEDTDPEELDYIIKIGDKVRQISD